MSWSGWCRQSGAVKAAPSQPTQKPRLVQRNKSFEPHVLVVPVGSVVAFPNHDPFFHNVFSLFEGKRFDLGLYEAGSTRDVHFDKPGISYIFCNIHPEMSAVVVALDTPYYGISDSRGQVVIANVPSGKYTLRVWYESALPETLKAMTREVTVSESVLRWECCVWRKPICPPRIRTCMAVITTRRRRTPPPTTGIEGRPGGLDLTQK